KGRTLSALLSERKHPTDDRARFLGIFEQICQAMAYAHSRGVIHRDLKPANVMVGAFGEVQVMDWGLAKVLKEGGIHDEQRERSKDEDDEVSVIQTVRSVGSDTPEGIGSETRAGSILGTPAYLPPEQALGHVDEMNERSDVFGLGAILCVILTGEPPYVADTANQVYRMAQKARLDDCFSRLDGCGADSDLIELAKACLQQELKDRPKNAGEVGQRISAYLESVESKLRTAEIERAAEAARAIETRKRLRVTLALACSVLLLFSAMGAGWMWTQHQSAERLAFVMQNINDLLSDARLHQQSAGQVDLDAPNGFNLRVRELRLALENAQKAAEFTKQAAISRDLRVSVERLLEKLESDLGLARHEAQQEATDRAIQEELELIRVSSADPDSELAAWQIEHLALSDGDDIGLYDNAMGQSEFLERPPAQYERVFRSAGIDLATINIEQAAHLIRQSRIREAYISALDDWIRTISESDVKELLKIPLDTWDTLIPREMTSTISTLELQTDGSILAARPSSEEDLHYQIEAQPATTTVTAVRLDVLPHDSLPNSGPGYHGSGNFHLGEIEVFLDRNGALQRQPFAQAIASYSWPARPITRVIDGDPSTDWHVWGELGQSHHAILVFHNPIELQEEDKFVIKLHQHGQYAVGHFRLSTSSNLDSASYLQLYRLVNAADDNAWRKRLRNALIAKDSAGISRLVDDPETRSQTAVMIAWLGAELRSQGRTEEAVTLLKRMQLLHPDDFWLNYELARSLQATDRINEGSMAMRAALASRPQSLLPYLELANLHYGMNNHANRDILVLKIADMSPVSAMARTRLGRELYRLGEPERATELLQEAIALDPQNIYAHLTFGIMLWNLKKHDEASAEFSKAIEIDPSDADAHDRLGITLFYAKNPQQALAEFRKAIELDPTYLPARYHLGNILIIQRKTDEGLAEYRKAIETPPKDIYDHIVTSIMLRALGKTDEALIVLRKAIDIAPNIAQLHNQLGYHLFHYHEKVDEAAAEFRKAIELNPRQVAAHKNLSKTLRKQGKAEEAIAVLRTAIEIWPGKADLHYELGYGYLQENADEAVTEFQRAIELNPKHLLAHQYLGVALRNQDKTEDAVAVFRKAIEISPKNADLHNELGFTLLRYRENAAEAIAEFRRAVELKPRHAQANRNLGVAIRDQGQTEEAIATFRKAIEISPRNADLHCTLGLLLCTSQTGYDEGIAEIRKAIELDPDNLFYRMKLGVTNSEYGYVDEALGVLFETIDLFPNASEPHDQIRLLLRDLADFERAVTEYRQKIAVNPTAVHLHNQLGRLLALQGDIPQAITEFRACLKLAPQNGYAHQGLGWMLYDDGDIGNAKSELQQSLKLIPNFALVHITRGLIFWDQNKYREALVEFQQAVEYRPQNPLYHLCAAAALEKMELFNEASAEYALVREWEKTSWDTFLGITVLSLFDGDISAERIRHPVSVIRDYCERGPMSMWKRRTLALAYLRMREPEPALKLLDEYVGSTETVCPTEWLLLAMTHWQRGDHPAARIWFDRVVEWQKTNQLNADQRRLLREAASLLGTEVVDPMPEPKQAL
ncbi:MAG: tetratricopeptide repeat protein, partial [Planctomycetaceae bacterium]|nr:tetratricopeptide repeat protein [Planctomycetaceae bacterium]